MRKKPLQSHLRMRKTYLSFGLVLLIVALALHTAYLLQSRSNMQRQAQQDHTQLLEQQRYHASLFTDEIASCASALSLSQRLQKVLVIRQTPDYLAFADCRDLLQEYETAPFRMYRLDLYVPSVHTLVTSSEGVFYHLEEKNSAVYDALLALPESANGFWTIAYQGTEPGIVSRYRNENYLTYVRQVPSLTTGKPRALLLLSVAYPTFSAYTTPAAGDMSSLFFDGVLLCGSVTDDPAWTTLASESLSGLTFRYQYRFHPGNVFSGVFGFVLLVILLFLLVSFFLLILISERQIARPIHHLLTGFEGIQQGAFETRLGHHDNEFCGDLNRGFDHMAQHLQESVTALVTERTRGEELRLQLLMMQVRPHFLYNIFNNMVWLVAQKKYAPLEELVNATAGFYRSALRDPEKEITLLENMDQLRHYVAIQRFRFGDRFTLAFDIPDELWDLEIPNLILQPLVENAIVHGFEEQQQPGYIRLKAVREAGRLFLTVSDDGKGIPEARLAQIAKAMAQDETCDDCFALNNVARRLRIRYGEMAQIQIRSQPEHGTDIVLCIPLQEGEPS
ncbi:MAG: histidine kinase [Clostridia bacterium]|nr:histidine kinase [Clostridia bacterium]